MKRLLAALVIFISLPSFAEFDACKDDLYKKIRFSKKTISVCTKKIEVEVADTESLRALGLMCRESLKENNGMLFVFEQPQRAAFWMKNTRISLSIAFFSKDKKLLNIEDMQTLDESSIHESKGLAQYALEMDLGWFKKNKIKKGCRLTIH